MSDVMCTQNSRTAPVGTPTLSWRGAVLLLLGALAGFAAGSDRTRTVATDAAVSVGEDWHGNVRRSHWAP